MHFLQPRARPIPSHAFGSSVPPQHLETEMHTYSSVAEPAELSPALASSSTWTALISRPFLFMSKRCLRSRALTNSRVARATAPGRLVACTLPEEPWDSFLRS